MFECVDCTVFGLVLYRCAVCVMHAISILSRFVALTFSNMNAVVCTMCVCVCVYTHAAEDTIKISVAE